VFAFRDPKGIRPLQIGKRTELTDNGEKKTSYCFASENNVFNFLGYETLPEIRPGELVFVDLQGNLFRQQIIKEKKKFPCMFEWVYFSNPDAEFESRNIYHIRTRLGEELAKQIQVSLNLNEIEPDCVASVPETSRIASQTISDRLQLPHKELLIKNRYIQRSFILPHQKERETAVDLKLMPIPSEVRGKKILLIDDSVVRGTTSKRIIKSLRAAGADKIYLALTCPPIQYACYYGVDFPDSEQLVAYNKDNQTIAQEIGADRLIYLSIDGLKKAIDLPDLCMGCIDQFYPAGVIDHSQGKSRRGHRSHEETPAQY
jgi:amidophosphoribosyltransferase